MFRKILIIILLLILNLLTVRVYSKPLIYKIINNEYSLESQLTKIINDINNILGDETCFIYLEEGYYNISNTIDIMVSDHPIIIVGADNKKTFISGSIEIQDKELLSNGLWRFKIPIHDKGDYIPDQLYVNGIRAKRSRIPNTGYYIINSVHKDNPYYSVSLSEKEMESLAGIGGNDVPILSIYRKWTASKRYLNCITDSTLRFSGKDFPSFNRLNEGNGIIVENTKKGIDQPGEWCVDKNGFIYYFPKKGELIEQTSFRIPIVEKLFSIKGLQSAKGSIYFQNIIFEHTTCQIPKEGIEFIQSASSMSAAIEVDNINQLSINNCEIRNTANYGIWLKNNCIASTISSNFFHDLGGGAIKIGIDPQVNIRELTRQIVIENNIIYNYGVLAEGAVGIILFNASHCRIKHNDIHYGNYTGISLGWVWGFEDSPSKNNEVAYNRISHIGTGLLNDLAGIYMLGKSEGTHIHHNIINDVFSFDHRGWGIYADEGTSGVTIDRNLVYNSTSGGFHQNYGAYNVVKNNIFAWGKLCQSTFSSTKGDYPITYANNIIIMETGELFKGSLVYSDKFVVRNNCYWSVSTVLPKVGNNEVLWWIENLDKTSVYQNPNFKNPKNNDFRLKKSAIYKSIGFEPFDYSKAGVYGKKKWRKLAESCR